METQTLKQAMSIANTTITEPRSVQHLMNNLKDYEWGKREFTINTIWNTDKCSRYILSLLQGYPGGQVVLNYLGQDDLVDQYEVIDGENRLRAITNFINGTLKLNHVDSIWLINMFEPYFIQAGLLGLDYIVYNGLPAILQTKLKETVIATAIMSTEDFEYVKEYCSRIK